MRDKNWKLANSIVQKQITIYLYIRILLGTKRNKQRSYVEQKNLTQKNTCCVKAFLCSPRTRLLAMALGAPENKAYRWTPVQDRKYVQDMV